MAGEFYSPAPTCSMAVGLINHRLVLPSMVKTILTAAGPVR